MAQYIPGSSVTLSASLSALAHQPVVDDAHVVSNLPQICVDYLSHNWQEEDVWKSWRNMTRHKHEIANGVRLENASWRTWWKQRNKLRTVSPETLNWLKDSDVTWLYGPLHTAEPVPPHKEPTLSDKLDLIKAAGKKPILKHRTLTELLSLPRPSSPILESSELTDEESLEYDNDRSIRPPLPHTKSDTSIIRRPSNRRLSPPRVAGMGAMLSGREHPMPSLQVNGLQKTRSRSDSSNSPRGGGSDLESNSGSTKERRHIHFSAFVQQCISIDQSGGTGGNGDEDEDDNCSRHPPSVQVTSVVSHHGRPLFLRRDSIEKDLISIAPIAPTILKSSDPHPAPSPAVVFVPPSGSFYEADHHILQYHAQQQKHDSYTPPISINIAGYASSSSTSSPSSGQSDEEEDDGVGFDYFSGPDLGLGQGYDPLAHSRGGSFIACGPLRNPQSSPTGEPSATQRDSQLTGSIVATLAGPNDRDDEPATSSNSSNQSDVTVQPPRPSIVPNGRHRSSLHGAPSQSPPARSPPRPGRGILKNADSVTAVPIAYRGSNDSPPDGAYLSPSDMRGRSLSPGGEERGRSNVRTPPAIEERERSSSRGTSSPIGSVSPNSSRPGSALGRRRPERGGAVSGEEIARTVPIGVVANAIVSSSGACPTSRKSKSTEGAARPSLVINHSPVPKEEGTGSSLEESISGAELERRRDDFWADSTDYTPPPPIAHTSIREKPRKAADDQAHVQDEIDGDGSQYSFIKSANASVNKTPANSPVMLRSRPLPTQGDMSSRLPHVTTPLPPGPAHTTACDALEAQARPCELDDDTLVGRAVDMVHSAKGLFGAIWNGRGPVPVE